MKKKPIRGICRLCLHEAELIDSHIIPKFFYKTLKAEDVAFTVTTPDPLSPEMKEQKGLTENLLCKKCDNVILQKNEDYLARNMYRFYEIEGQNRRRSLMRGFDYEKTKRAILSIFWRLSICSHSSVRHIDFGSKHEERIRGILLNDESPIEREYPLLATIVNFSDGIQKDWIVPGDSLREEGNRVYRLLLNGVLFNVLLGQAPVDDFVLKMNLKKNGDWWLAHMHVSQIPFLREICLKMKDKFNRG